MAGYVKQTWKDLDPNISANEQPDSLFTERKIMNIENAIALANSTLDDTIGITGYNTSQYTGPSKAEIGFSAVDKVQRLILTMDKPTIDDTTLSDTTMFSKKKILEDYPIHEKVEIDEQFIYDLMVQYEVDSVNYLLFKMENVVTQWRNTK